MILRMNRKNFIGWQLIVNSFAVLLEKWEPTGNDGFGWKKLEGNWMQPQPQNNMSINSDSVTGPQFSSIYSAENHMNVDITCLQKGHVYYCKQLWIITQLAIGYNYMIQLS